MCCSERTIGFFARGGKSVLLTNANNGNCSYILFTKLPWVEDSEGTFRSLSQAATCTPARRRLHAVPLLAERQAGTLWIPIFIVFGLTWSGVEPESTVSAADNLITGPLIAMRGGVLEDVLGLEDTFWSPWPWPRRSSPWPRGLKSSKIELLKFCGAPEKFFGKRFFVEIAWKIFVKTFFLESTCACVLRLGLEGVCLWPWIFFVSVFGLWPWIFWRALALVSFALASRVSVFGLGFFLCPWPWPWSRALCPRLHLWSLFFRDVGQFWEVVEWLLKCSSLVCCCTMQPPSGPCVQINVWIEHYDVIVGWWIATWELLAGRSCTIKLFVVGLGSNRPRDRFSVPRFSSMNSCAASALANEYWQLFFAQNLPAARWMITRSFWGRRDIVWFVFTNCASWYWVGIYKLCEENL